MRAILRAALDPYLFYTATLTPIVVAVAVLGQRPGEPLVAVALGVAAVGTQLLLSLVGRVRIRPSLGWQLLRLAVPLAYVAAASHFVGGPALPLIALYIPIVAGASAIGRRQGILTAAVAAVFFLLPALSSLDSPQAVPLRGISLAGVTFVVAFGTRRIVRALEDALAKSRAAVIAERRRARQIEALESVGRVLASTGPGEGRIDQVLGVIVEQFRYEHVSLYLGDGDRVHLVAQRGYRQAIESFHASSGVAGRVMRTRQLAFVPDVSADPDYIPGTPSTPSTPSTTSLISAPLAIEGRFLGVLNVETSGGRTLDHTDRSLIGILAGRIGSAVALGQDRQALADQARLFSDIGAFASAVSASVAIDPLARAIVDAIGRVVPADIVAVTLLDRIDGRYRVRAVRGVDEEAIGAEVAGGNGLASRAMRDRATVRVDELDDEKLPRAARELYMPELSHGLGLPLIRDGVVVGSLTIGRRESGSRFTDLEIEGLELVASHAALAVANAFLHEEVSELAVRDGLTGLYNRRHFDDALDRLLAAHRRELLGAPRPLSAIVFDLDHFGIFNKAHGHQVGDQILRLFADVLRSRFRASDLVARLGGEEFVAVLDHADLERAVTVADEVRVALAARTLALEDGTQLGVTVSAGCAQLDPDDPTRATLLRTADVALFMAKRAGRDRVVAA